MAADVARGGGVRLVLLGKGWEHLTRQLGPQALMQAGKVAVSSSDMVFLPAFPLYAKDEFLWSNGQQK